MNIDSSIYLAGHKGMVGQSLIRTLTSLGYANIITRTRSELDLTNQHAVQDFFSTQKPEYVFLAAAKVGGILANNTYKADFIYDNMLIASNIIHSAWKHGVKKLLNLGSSCIYPKFATQPIKEEYLLTGKLEPTNEPYAIAKIAAIKLCKYFNEQYDTHFISAMPSNLYGIGDNFSLETSHVLPAIIRKFHEAKVTNRNTVTLWGDGSPKREFLFVDDLSDALVYIMNTVSKEDIGEHLNVGYGNDVSIRALAEIVQDITGYQGEVRWDTTKPNGTPRKLMDSSQFAQLGWKACTDLAKGIAITYEWFQTQYDIARK